jgi:UPF0755 protein
MSWRAAHRRLLRGLGAAVLVLVLLVGGGAFWAHSEIDGSADGAAVSFYVPPGAGLSALSSRLHQSGVISNTLIFRAWCALHSPGAIQPGQYQLSHDEPYGRLLAQLQKGPTTYAVVVPPGFTQAQIVETVSRLRGVSKKSCLAALHALSSPYQPAGSHDLEGLLFPDTYRAWAGEGCSQILSGMLARFVDQARQLGLSPSGRWQGLDAYQLVTAASIVEREAKLAVDRPLVAEVIYNRLRSGEKLQIDATVLYGLGNPPGSPSSADLAIPTPYNTYLNAGLPPTPIASPGAASLQAVLHPDQGPYLYYVVVSKNGAEAFSATLAGQNANIRLARSRGLGG